MKRILMNFTDNMIQTALVDDGRLVEVIVDRKDAASIAGNIYAGLVKTILPNHFAFVDIGEGRGGLLPLGDNRETAMSADGAPRLKAGQSVLVQVLKDPSVRKGALLTTQVSISDRHMALYLSPVAKAGVSRKIENTGERKRLKRIGLSLAKNGAAGVIMRTESMGAVEEDLSREFHGLHSKLMKISDLSRYAKPPALIHVANGPFERSLGVLISGDVMEIVIDSASAKDSVINAAAKAGGKCSVRVHEGPAPLFAAEFVATQLERALSKKVWLKSGGFLIIEQTEACAVIDVNTGRLTRGNPAFRTNMEAAREIAAQIRLRNLSGIIAVDFIDMDRRGERDALIGALSEAVKHDRLPVNVEGMSFLGIVMMTRKKEREPLSGLLLKSCPLCGGEGRVEI